jgi:hypothetical protein
MTANHRTEKRQTEQEHQGSGKGLLQKANQEIKLVTP